MGMKHIFMAIIATALWGLNFTAIRVGFDNMPPFLFLTLRFIVTTVPILFMIPRPNVSWWVLTKISATLWIGQFAFLFLGIYMGVPSGMASLIIQLQSIFTVILSVMIYGYKPHYFNIIGMVTSFIGILLIALQFGAEGSLLAFFFLIIAAFSVSSANILFKQAESAKMISVITWSSLIPPIPMFLLSLSLEGWSTIIDVCANMGMSGYLALFYSAWVSTLIGTTIWGTLMRAYDPAMVVPFSLLVPVFGITSGILFLDETISIFDVVAITCIILGLCFNQFGNYYRKKGALRSLQQDASVKQAA